MKMEKKKSFWQKVCDFLNSENEVTITPFNKPFITMKAVGAETPAEEPVSVTEKPPLSVLDIEKEIRRKQVEDYITIRGKVFQSVCVIGQKFHMWTDRDYQVIDDDHYPQELDDIQPPPAWVNKVGELWLSLPKLEKTLDAIYIAKALFKKKSDWQFIVSNDNHYPLIKLYTDNSWIEHGWAGPAIVPCHLEGKTKAIGIIPDSLTVVPLDEMTAMVTGLGEMIADIPEDYDVVRMAKKIMARYDEFIKGLADE
jgi:hypothetical protein